MVVILINIIHVNFFVIFFMFEIFHSHKWKEKQIIIFFEKI